MTASPSTPPNRRRRRIVVITIAVLVLGLGWWFWPRVDQRFVGKWGRLTSHELGGPKFVETVLVLNEDGTGESLNSFVWGWPGTFKFKWWIRQYSEENTSIVMQFPSERNGAVVLTQLFLSRHGDVSVPMEIFEWEVWGDTERSITIGPHGDYHDLIRLK